MSLQFLLALCRQLHFVDFLQFVKNIWTHFVNVHSGFVSLLGDLVSHMLLQCELFCRHSFFWFAEVPGSVPVFSTTYRFFECDHLLEAAKLPQVVTLFTNVVTVSEAVCTYLGLPLSGTFFSIYYWLLIANSTNYSLLRCFGHQSGRDDSSHKNSAVVLGIITARFFSAFSQIHEKTYKSICKWSKHGITHMHGQVS